MAITISQLPSSIGKYKDLFIGKQGRKKYREILIEVNRKLTNQLTPIDTGRARSNWFITTHFPDTLSKSDATGGEVVRNVTAINSINDVSQTVFISNNLEYIEALENNHSPQTDKMGILNPAIEIFVDLIRKEYLKAFR